VPRRHTITAEMIQNNSALKSFSHVKSMSYGLHEHPSIARQLAKDLQSGHVTLDGEPVSPEEHQAILQTPERSIQQILKNAHVPPFFIRWYIQSEIHKNNERQGAIRSFNYHIDLQHQEQGISDLLISLSDINQGTSTIQLEYLFNGRHYALERASTNDKEIYQALSPSRNSAPPSEHTTNQAEHFKKESISANEGDSLALNALMEKNNLDMPYLSQPKLLADDIYAIVLADFDHSLQQFNILAARTYLANQNLLDLTKQDHLLKIENILAKLLNQITELGYKSIKKHAVRMTQGDSYRKGINAYRKADSDTQHQMVHEPNGRIEQAVSTSEHAVKKCHQQLIQLEQLAQLIKKVVNEKQDASAIKEIQKRTKQLRANSLAGKLLKLKLIICVRSLKQVYTLARN
jgi:hypothetical protein